MNAPVQTKSQSQRLHLQPEKNVWRVSKASRVAVLIDAANYFGALRAAMLEARHSIQIIGWDVDSRTPLVGPSGEASDGLPLAFGDFLDALAAAKPWLTIRILLWDYSVFFATEREPLPTLALRWKRPPQIDLCLDDSVPSGSSHHQKIVVVDDSLAFAGGLDITIRRWDDCRHLATHPFRTDPAGKPYAPFHDVQMMLDGPAATAIAELARSRWEAATCETPAATQGNAAPWPKDVVVDLADVAVGIARTMPAIADDESRPEIREAEQLFLDMVAAAQRTIYIESQYLTYLPMAEAIARRLREVPTLEVALICPKSYHGSFERQVMLSGRTDFLKVLEQAKAPDRCMTAAPCAIEGKCDDPEMRHISIHSKVMIVDDCHLRIGSANLCNRSMGTDSECDLVVTAQDDDTHKGIIAVRDRLLGEHCGVSERAFAEAHRQHGSLISAMRALALENGKLCVIDSQTDADETTLPLVQAMADPARPLPNLLPPVKRYMQDGAAWLGRHAMLVFCATLLLSLTGLSAAWAWTPLIEDGGIANFQAWMSDRGSLWNLLAVVGVFVLAGFVAVPVVALIVATTALYGIWPGLGYAAAGAMCSAVAIYLVGRQIGHPVLRRLIGPRLNRITDGLAERGIMAITVVRLLPIAPFSMVNLVAGALRVPPADYIIGTFLGLLPGFAIMGLVGRQVIEVIREPSAGGIGMLVGLLALSLALSVLLQMGIKAFRKSPS